jgi:hypothetical protein
VLEKRDPSWSAILWGSPNCGGDLIGAYSGDAFDLSGCINGFGTAASVEVSISSGVEGSVVVYFDENCGSEETAVGSSGGPDATCFSGTVNSILFNP